MVLLAHHQADAFGVGLLGSQVHHRLAGGLGKHRRRIGGMTKVDGAGAQGFEQLWAGGEFVPADVHPLRCQGFFQGAAAFEDVDAVELLVADAQGFARFGMGQRAGQQQRGEGGKQAAGEQATQGGMGRVRHGRTPGIQGQGMPENIRSPARPFNFFIPNS
ncbi:hypothetical protein D3C80_1566220 [compost metagenome]